MGKSPENTYRTRVWELAHITTSWRQHSIPEHRKDLAAGWGRSPPPIHTRHLKTNTCKELVILVIQANMTRDFLNFESQRT